MEIWSVVLVCHKKVDPPRMVPPSPNTLDPLVRVLQKYLDHQLNMYSKFGSRQKLSSALRLMIYSEVVGWTFLRGHHTGGSKLV